jgi:glycosyltransferase involved in cell wall biosynthesis
MKKRRDVNKAKIVLITNCCPFYRLPLFKKLAELYDMKFFFTDTKRKKWHENNSQLFSSTSIIKLIQMLTFKKFDVVISAFPSWSSFFAFIISKLRKKPLVLWTEEWYQPRTLSRKMITSVLKFIARHSSAFVVPGARSRSHISFLGTSPGRIFVSPNASYVDLDHTTFEKAKKIRWKLGISDKKVILYLGRLVPEKGADILIRAFVRIEREIKDAFLLIVGSFEDEKFKNYLVDLCKKLGLENVRIQNYVERSAREEGEKSAYYVLSNIYILPSIKTPMVREAWGLTLNEAMYVGKPVISTDAVGASCDLIKNGVNGYIVKNTDIYELYKVMKSILSDDELERKMGEESRKIIANFTYENMVKGFKEAVDKALVLD